jgi:signal transduction histidine kinase
MMVAVPIEQFAGEVIGMMQGTIDLKYVSELISSIRVGKAGDAYLVSSSGQLIAHSDLSLVLQNQDLRDMNHVKAALEVVPFPSRVSTFISQNVQREKVFTSYVVIPSLGWAVFAEQPIDEIYAPLYASMFRTSAVLLAGLCVALAATLVVSRRVVGPLEILQAGVSRIREGDLTARVNLKTGDEIEILADEFDAMAANLNNAYSELEGRVAERTAALRTANVKLEEASRHKSQFLANANHELRTPVSAIIGYGRILSRETQGQITELQRDNLQDLLNNAERLLDMIDMLLDLAKIEAGKIECRIDIVDVGELVQSVTSTIEPFLSTGLVRLSRDVALKIPFVRTDREKLRQILLNLLSNAVKFTERGEIKISALSRGNRLEITVADTGIGIEKEHVQQIFEEFYRGDTVRARKYRGTGLGLAIVKKLVTVLGGEIAVESESGKGSVFTLPIPLEYEQQTPAGLVPFYE